MTTQYALRNKNLTPLLLMILCVCYALTTSVHAQAVHIPDPNLRTAIIDALKLPRGTHLTEEHMRQLTELDVRRRDVYDLSGLEFAINLTYLRIANNPISDLRPITGLTNLKTLIMESVPDTADINVLIMERPPSVDINVLGGLINLEHFDISGCNIRNIDVVKHFTKLRILSISNNSIVDISPVANLSQLRFLWAFDNEIEDITPLSNLHNLRALDIYRNLITDHSPVDDLSSLEHFTYDQVCDMPAIPLERKLYKREYPLLAGLTFTDQPQLSRSENFALNDMVTGGAQLFELRIRESKNGFEIAGKDIDYAIQLRDDFLALNPNMLFLTAIEFRAALYSEYPEDWPYWLRDANGNILDAGESDGYINFVHPDVQDRIVEKVLAVDRCGLLDGIWFDFWYEHGPILVDPSNLDTEYVGTEAEQRARDNILARIRAETRPDFLITGNTGITIIPRTGWAINGGHMETVFPDRRETHNIEYELPNIEKALLWLASNIRQPRVNMLDARTIPTQSPFSPDNLRWARALTTLTLTHSNGYLSLHHILTPKSPDEQHIFRYWYDFWDANLGQPVGEKGQLYQDIDGLYIREFTNGWAVYNHSGAEQTIRLHEDVVGVSSRLEGMEHTLPNLDGEMYLRVKPPNPADVNDDGVVNIFDLTLVAQAISTGEGAGDVNGDGVVNVFDLVFVAGAIGGGGAVPAAYSLDISIIGAADVAKWLALAQGLGVGDANFQRGIRFLEGLLAALTPKETTLLPNYPNPFNPETWIPYRLAREAEVAITIYDTKGRPVRRLALGNQATGYYAERGKAAYWDGRNESGEAVASGIYVYHFQAGDYAASRRMVIVK